MEGHHIRAILLLALYSLGGVVATPRPGDDGYPILRQVHIITSHGATTPSFPFSEEMASSWSDGPGELTTLGMQHMYDLGKAIRSRYSFFFDYDYKRDEIEVLSIDRDRNLESAEVILAGIFPPSGDQIWNQDIKWQPIPVHTVPKEHDNMLYLGDYETSFCPRYDQLLEETAQSKWFQAANASFEHFYTSISQPLGITEDMEPALAYAIFDTLNQNKIHGRGLPDWTNENIMAKIQTQLIPLQYQLEFNTVEKVQLMGGPLMDKIVKDIQYLTDEPLESHKKVYLYSAEDENIIAQMLTYGTYDWYTLPYGAAMFVEILEVTPGSYGIHIALRNTTTEIQATGLQIKGCAEQCPFEKFKQIVAPYQLSSAEQRKRCGSSSPAISSLNTADNTNTQTTSTTSNLNIILGFLVAVMALALLVMGAVLYRQKQARTVERAPLLRGYGQTFSAA